MIIETKFNFNQEVFKIAQYSKQEFVKCTECEGSGHLLTTKGKYIECPDCYREGEKNQYLPKQWYISHSGKIGKISPELYSKKYEKHNKSKITYMLDTSGVGSGSLFYEEELFDSKEEAQKECDKRNLNIENADSKTK